MVFGGRWFDKILHPYLSDFCIGPLSISMYQFFSCDKITDQLSWEYLPESKLKSDAITVEIENDIAHKFKYSEP